VYITLDPSSGEHQLHDAEDFSTFSVVVPAAADLPLPAGAVPAELGRPEVGGTHVFVLSDAVLRLAGADDRDGTWHEAFRSMLTYAGKAGWVSPDGLAIRAHCAPRTGVVSS
jgi:hypothetical protein